MRSRLLPFAALTVIATALLAAGSPWPAQAPVDVIAHEWGTFTSVAGPDGSAVQWRPGVGPSDLPGFVEQRPYIQKGAIGGTVRTETPVVYFYAPRETNVRLSVRFRHGVITEWFPRADVTPNGTNNLLADPEDVLAWNNVKISPDLPPDFRTEPGKSHYYVARKTDAAPLETHAQRERFLFYRGVGRFAPPISAVVGEDDVIRVASRVPEPLTSVILFENRGGRVAYEVQEAAERTMTFRALTLDDESPSPAAELVRILVAHGLYRKEAEAMVETWRDSWFEEGARLFYIVPRSFIDDILPLTIQPPPKELVRVFVGRMELATGRTRREIATALAANDRAALAKKYGRFLEPLLAATRSR